MVKPVIILVGSVTYAMKAREMLSKHGIRAAVERVPPSEASGCGYGVRVPEGPDKADQAERILREGGIKVLGRAEPESGRGGPGGT